MEIFQTELPKVYAEHLDSVDALKAHVEVLGASHELDSDSMIVKVSYRSAYGDSVDEVRSLVVRLGAWVLWSSSKPSAFYYVYTEEKVFTPELIPRGFLESLQLELKPVLAERPREPKNSEPGLW